MKPSLLVLMLLGAHSAIAYEYTLQFNASGAYGLVVAGYEFGHNEVTGNCSYYTETHSWGRGGRTVITYHYNTCTWDLYGNLISLTPVSAAPVAPPVLSQNGTETIYAESGTNSTGRDARGFGFVNTRSAHYSWEAPSGYAVIPDAVQTIPVTLISDGDLALIFDAANVAASVSGLYTPTPGTATVSATTCKSSVPVGSKCSVTISYNPTTISCTGSPYGYAYTNIKLSLVTDAGASPDHTEGFTITGVPICDD